MSTVKPTYIKEEEGDEKEEEDEEHEEEQWRMMRDKSVRNYAMRWRWRKEATDK